MMFFHLALLFHKRFKVVRNESSYGREILSLDGGVNVQPVKVPVKQIENWKLWLRYELKLSRILTASIPILNEFVSLSNQSVSVFAKNDKPCFILRIKHGKKLLVFAFFWKKGNT